MKNNKGSYCLDRDRGQGGLFTFVVVGTKMKIFTPECRLYP